MHFDTLNVSRTQTMDSKSSKFLHSGGGVERRAEVVVEDVASWSVPSQQKVPLFTFGPTLFLPLAPQYSKPSYTYARGIGLKRNCK